MSEETTAPIAGPADPHDALRTQLVWNRLLAIVEEQAQTLMRTAFSTVVREAGDLSAGVFGTDGAMLAQAVTGTPGHVNAMAASVGKFLTRFPVATLRPGDVLLTNDPWDGTGHLNDFTVVTPVFLESGATADTDTARRTSSERPPSHCVALFAATSHIADVGGRGFGPDALSVFEEGINIPIMPLFRAGTLDQTLMNIIKANVRDPVVAEGDLYSLTACNDIGAQQLIRMMADFGMTSLTEVGHRIITASRDAVLAEVARLPHGVTEHEMWVDGYDEPVRLRCRVAISGSGVDVDFAGSSSISRFGINVPLTYAQAYASFGVRCIIGNDVPNNAGSLATVRVTAPEGCILNAPRPAPVSARHALGQMLPDVILGCLEQVMPDAVPAEGASCIWNPVLLSEATGSAADNLARAPFVTNPIFNGGTGARVAKDGLSTTAFPSGVRTTPTEVNELTAPLIVWRKEYRTDSGGAGEYRGGLGQVVEIAHADGAPFAVSKMFDRIDHPAQGRRGGRPGAPGRVYLKADGGAGEVVLRGKGREVVPAGAILVMETPGGGGIGDPSRRHPDALAADRADELATGVEVEPART